MKTISFKKTHVLRKDRNSLLIKKMRNGENLTSFNSVDSWFPPRPIIEKDPKAITRLYGDQDSAQTSSEETGLTPLKLAQ